MPAPQCQDHPLVSARPCPTPEGAARKTNQRICLQASHLPLHLPDLMLQPTLLPPLATFLA